MTTRGGSSMKWALRIPQPYIKRAIILALGFSLLSIWILAYYVSQTKQNPRWEPPQANCKLAESKANPFFPVRPQPMRDVAKNSRTQPAALVFVESAYSKLGQEIAALLEANRLKYKTEIVSGKSFPSLTEVGHGKYSLVIFENLNKYLHMDKWNRDILDRYCLEFNVGIISFAGKSEDNLLNKRVGDFPLYMHSNLRVKDCSLNPDCPLLYLTRAGETWRGNLPGEDWTIFQPNHTTYEPVAYAKTSSLEYVHVNENLDRSYLVTVMQDLGLYDGIQRVFFGNDLNFWLHRLLFLDSATYLSQGKLSLSLERYILVDIDDIFVGKVGTRMQTSDVKALISAQSRLGSLVPGFRFNLGFSGYFYHSGDDIEDIGDDALLANAHEFWWFPHMWAHTQPHTFTNETSLREQMILNKRFAKEHGIPTDGGYAVAPHHSGVYPVHVPLYEAWRKVWGIKVTSTEEYPHLRPPRHRRGFIYKNIVVLPRQTCGLFTHTIFIDKYPGGRSRLEESIHGGELFQTFINSRVNIFMTHLSNYGNDRLALYTFESVIKFVQCWTNLQLKTVPPMELGRKYFDLYPEEANPVWQNPCDDKRHLAIWSKYKTCDRLPRFLVIGPQKTGTTALYAFLSMHPNILSNFPSSKTFEEVQFFNGANYYRGIDWYMEFFPTPSNSSLQYLFEKSATYFDNELVPKRAHALLPRAKIVTILINPARRAYSWYQHMRAHEDVIALNHSFYQVVTATDEAPGSLRELKNRCLNPGKYAVHLEMWLNHYPASQLLILDGDQLRTDPVSTMWKTQKFLKVKPHFDYDSHLRYDPSKGFYCQVMPNGKTKCLGRSKGRHYPPMEADTEKFLSNYYLPYNVELSKLLTRLAQQLPDWLREELRGR
ncbi:LOW QUALITY PROTEIN: bifunctional heparan sulfate N-deacetylase/N-sulfotransferase 2-like [Branchiostoma floridae x Branchiostoma japonicum]